MTLIKKEWKGLLGVYKITSPSGRIYVGSGDLYDRYTHYKNANCKGQPKIYNSIFKYGWEAHVFEVICVDTFENLYCLEHFFGELYDVINSGLNCTLPSCGDKKAITSDETKEKQRKNMLGNQRLLGFTHSEETIKMMSKVNSKKTILNTETGETFFGWREAGEKYGLSKSYLITRLNGTVFNNLPLVYLNEEHLIKTEKQESRKIIINKVTGEEFLGVQAAADSIGMTRNLLKRRLQGYMKNNTNLVYKDNQDTEIDLIPNGRIINNETGVVYKNIFHAAKTINLTGRELYEQMLKGDCVFSKIKHKNMSKPIINILTKEIYESVISCSEKTEFTKSSLQKMLSGDRKNTTNLMYLDEYNLQNNDKTLK